MNGSRARIAIFAVAVLAMSAIDPAVTDAAPVPIRGEDPPFTTVIPDGFVELSGTRDGVFVFGRLNPGRAPTVITLRPLPSTIANLPIDERAAREEIQRLVPEARVTLEHARSMDLNVPTVVTWMPRNQLVISATLPSSPRAIQLSVTGDSVEATAVQRALHDVMASFHASTNWLTRAQVLRRNAARWTIGLAWALLIAFGLGWLVRFRKRPGKEINAQSLWLATSGVTFLASAALLMSLPVGASAFSPLLPLLVAVVVLINAFNMRRTRPVASSPATPS